jgi:hypothetical protein
MRALLVIPLLAFAAACAAPPLSLRAPDPAPPMASPAAPPCAAPPEAPATVAVPEAKLEVVVDEQGCVKSPLAHGAQFTLSHYAATLAERLGKPPTLADFEAPNRCFSEAAVPDLDGDGIDETEVVEGCSWGSYGGLHLLYFSNKGCPRFAGDLVSGELSPLSTQASGVRDLSATWSSGCAGNDFKWTHYRWNGSAYRVIDEATCYLCDDKSISRPPANANKHAHCKAEAKTRSSR